jgi:hypothetical protein
MQLRGTVRAKYPGPHQREDEHSVELPKRKQPGWSRVMSYVCLSVLQRLSQSQRSALSPLRPVAYPCTWLSFHLLFSLPLPLPSFVLTSFPPTPLTTPSLTLLSQVVEPGQVRLSMTFWMPKVEVEYIIDAVLFIAEHGWKFVRHYK